MDDDGYFIRLARGTRSDSQKLRKEEKYDTEVIRSLLLDLQFCINILFAILKHSWWRISPGRLKLLADDVQQNHYKLYNLLDSVHFHFRYETLQPYHLSKLEEEKLAWKKQLVQNFSLLMEAKSESQGYISRRNMSGFISNICSIAIDMLRCRDDLDDDDDEKRAIRASHAKLTFLRAFVHLADNEGMGSLLNCIHDYTLKVELLLFDLWAGETQDKKRDHLASVLQQGGINVDKPCSLLIILDVFNLSENILLGDGTDWDYEPDCGEVICQNFVWEALLGCIPKFLNDNFCKDYMPNLSFGQELEDGIQVLHECLKFLGTCVEDLSLNMQVLFARAVASIGFLWVFNLQDSSKEEIKHVRFQLSILTASLYISAAEIVLMKQYSYESSPIIFMMELHKDLEDGLKVLRECLTYTKDGYLEDKVLFLSQWEVVPRYDKLSFDDCGETDLALSKLLGTTRLIQAHVLALELLNRDEEFRMEDQLVKLSDKLGFLVGLVKKFSDSNVNQILFWLDTSAVTTKVAGLISFFSMDMTEERLKDGNLRRLVHVIADIELLEAELMLNSFLNHHHADVIVPSSNIGILRNGFRLLRTILTDSREQDREIMVLSDELVKVAIPLVSKLFHNMSNKSMTMEMNDLIFDLLRNMMAWETIVTDRYLQIRRSSQPTHSRTDRLGFIECLVDNLSNLSSSMPALPWMKYQIGRAFLDLKSCRSLLNDTIWEQNEDNELNNLVSQLTQAAYEVEYVAEAFVVGDGNTWSKRLWISDLIDEIKQISVKITKVLANQSYKDGADNPSGTSDRVLLLPVDNTSSTNEVVVGMEEQEEKVTNQLIRGSTKLGIVSIVGMGGLGKTTLAKKVFDSPSVQHSFDVRAWCCISKVYQKREILLEILGYVIEVTPDIRRMTDDDLSNRLRQLLLGRSYLIVMDDMWDILAWKELQQSFPKGDKKSRILFTSRINDIASKSGYGLEPCFLDLLSNMQSWKLLERKLFKDGSCPSQFHEVGWEIAIKCKGLPLAIVVISGLLSTKEMNLDWWKQVAGNLNSIVVGNSKTFTNIIDLSYHYLPDYLKPCFLYFGVFQEDERLMVSNLINLWTAEGFIRNKEAFNDNKNINDVARDYLQELVSRNLVSVIERTSMGGIKACRVHDLLHELCCARAQEEKFLHVVKDLDSNVKYDHHRRVCIYSERKTFIESRPSGQCVRTLLFFATRGKEETHSRYICKDTSFISLNFKLLRTLKLDSLKIGDTLPQGFELLIHLRFLAVMGMITLIPDSIQSLSNLEFFYVKGLRGEIRLPHGIWKSKKLRNLHLKDRFAFTSIGPILDQSSHLDNLESLSTLFLPYQESEHLLRRLSKLHKLKCIFSEYSGPDTTKDNEFPNLKALNQLESLKVLYHGKVKHPPSLFNFPETLKKLTLSKFRLPWNQMSAIGSLPCLEVLKLQIKAFEGEEWEVESNEFTNLKYLKLDYLDIVRWNTSDDSFPCLEKLVLQNCKQLEEIPFAFGESSTLHTIQMQWCSSSGAKSVRCIQDEQMETSGRKLNVFIHPSHF